MNEQNTALRPAKYFHMSPPTTTLMVVALDADLSEGATGLSESCLGQLQFIDCSIEWSLVKNSYGVR